MRKRSCGLRITVLLAMLALVAACGGGGGGGGGGGATPLATGGFVKDPHAVSIGSWGGIISAGVSTVRLQHLYSGPSGTSPIDGAGYITAIAYKASGVVSSAITCPNVTIKMGHTSLDTLTTTFANNVEQGKGFFATVMQDKTVTAPVGAADDYVKITLDTPYYYNGVDNLVVELSRGTACTGNLGVRYDDTAANQAMYSTDLAAATGTLDPAPNMRFYFSGGDNAVEYGGVDSAPTPFDSLWRTQMLYLASEITGTGPITGIGLQANATTVTGSYTYTLKLGHTTVSALTATYADNFDAGAPSTIVSNGSFTIPAGIPAGEYIWIPFPGTFTYNGKDNLIVDIDVSAGTGLNSVRYNAVGAVTRLIYDASGSTVAASGNDAALHTKFRFNGGPVTAGLGADSTSGQVFDGDADGAQIQCLYHAAELGTGGTISGIGVRLLSDSVAATHSDYTVRIGHTTKTQLSGADAYAVNMDENRVAHSGSFSVPAGLKAGDWVTIPLGTAFTYDPSKNLAVFFSTSGGAGAFNTVRWKFSGTQYPNRVVGSENGANTSPTWTDDGILEIRFNLQ